MKTILTTKYVQISNSDLNEVLGFPNKKYRAGTHLTEKVLNISTVDKVHLICNCVDGPIVNAKGESILFSSSLDARPGYKISKEPSSFLVRKVNKNKVDEVSFYPEDDDGHQMNFNGESLTFTAVLMKI